MKKQGSHLSYRLTLLLGLIFILAILPNVNAITWGANNITLNSPANNSIQYTNNVITNATANITGSGQYLTNMSLWTKVNAGDWGLRNTTTISLSSQQITPPVPSWNTQSLAGDHGWKITPLANINLTAITIYTSSTGTTATLRNATGTSIATASISGKTATFSPARTLNANTQYIITIDDGANPYTSPTDILPYGNEILTIDGGATTANYGVSYSFVPTIQNMSYIIINTSILTQTFTNTYSSGDNVIWNVQACATDGTCGFAPSNYTFTIDSTPPAIAVNYPTALLNYGRVNQTLQLNWTATDTNLDKCWYNYNGTNISIAGCLSGVYNISNITLSTKKNVTFYANDTAGNLNTTFWSWDYYLFANNISYKTATTTTSSENFIIYGVKDSSISSISAKLNYNGANYTSIVSIVGNNFTISNNFEIPSGPASRDFFWYITAVGTGGTIYIQTENFTQTVSNLSITHCTGTPPPGLTLNFTLYDSGTMALLNGSFQATLEYYAFGGTGTILETYNYADLNENRSNWMFCLNSSGLNVSLDGFFSYEATGYDRREYIIQNGIVGNFTQNIPLFLAATADTDIVTIYVKDQNYNNLVGALVAIQEWNIGTNTYQTIGMMTTSSEGTGIINLELYNKWYRAVIYYEGNIVEVTDVQKLSETDWFITVQLTTTNPYDLFGSISHGLTFDEVTNITTFTWLDSSGYTQQGCLEVRKLNSLGYAIVYYDCITSVSGTINYQLTEAGEYQILGIIHLIPAYNVSSIQDYLAVKIGISELTDRVSRFGKVLSFIFIGTSTFIGISAGNPYLGVIGLVLSVLGSWKMGWLNITSGIFWGIISIVLIILARISRKGT